MTRNKRIISNDARPKEAKEGEGVAEINKPLQSTGATEAFSKKPFKLLLDPQRAKPNMWYQLLEELYDDADTFNQSIDNRTKLPDWFPSEKETIIEEDIEEYTEELEFQTPAKEINTQKCELTPEQEHIMSLDNIVIDYISKKLKQNNQSEAANKIQNFLTALNNIREHNTSDKYNILRNHTILHLAQKADRYLGDDMPEIFNIIVKNIEDFPKKSDYLRVKCLCSTPGELIAAAERYDAACHRKSLRSKREKILNKLLTELKQQEAAPTHSQPTASNTPIESKQKNSLTTTTSTIDPLLPQTRRRRRLGKKL